MPEIFLEISPRWFYFPTIIVIAFIFASFGIHHCTNKIHKFSSSLNANQKAIYEKIKNERQNIYGCAMMQGFFVSLIYIVYASVFIGRIKSIYHLISDIAAIIFIVSYFVYTLQPKKNYMLLDGNLNEEERKEWYAIYICMEKSFWGHFLIGIVIGGFLLSILDLWQPPLKICISKNKKKSRSKKR